MSDEVFIKLKRVINEINEDAEVKIDTNLRKDLEFDSLDMINFYFEVEKAFNIKIPEPDLSEYELIRVDKIMEYLQAKIW